jgi:hypothetical protein
MNYYKSVQKLLKLLQHLNTWNAHTGAEYKVHNTKHETEMIKT